MVNCAMVGCYNRSKNKPEDENYSKAGFFNIPKVITGQCERTAMLTTKRRALWFRRIRRADLDESSTHYRVCGEHFITGRPANHMNDKDPDWAPSLKLGYTKRSNISDDRRKQRQERERNLRQREAAESLLDLTRCCGLEFQEYQAASESTRSNPQEERILTSH